MDPLAHFANSGGIFVFCGAIVLIFYFRPRQGTRFKYFRRFPPEQPSEVFWFKSQIIDNFLRTFFVSIPISIPVWTQIMSFSL